MDFIERFENKFLKSYLSVYENISLFPLKNKNISLDNKIIEQFQSTVKKQFEINKKINLNLFHFKFIFLKILLGI